MSVINPEMDEIEMEFYRSANYSSSQMYRRIEKSRVVLSNTGQSIDYVDSRGDLCYSSKLCPHEFRENVTVKGFDITEMPFGLDTEHKWTVPRADWPALFANYQAVLKTRTGLYVAQYGAVYTVHGPEPSYDLLVPEAHKMLRKGKSVYAELGTGIRKIKL